MIRRRTFAMYLCLATFSIVAAGRNSIAEEYTWARTNFGASNVNRPYGTANNGYGGYWVPKNQYGNNYEGQRFTNPTGFIVPAQQAQQPQAARWGHRMRRR